jgi:hypothetical protein
MSAEIEDRIKAFERYHMAVEGIEAILFSVADGQCRDRFCKSEKCLSEVIRQIAIAGRNLAMALPDEVVS